MTRTLVDCGCDTKVHKDGSGVEVYYCQLHEAAPDLLKACQFVLKGLNDMTTEEYSQGGDRLLRGRLIMVIAKAGAKS